MHRYVINDFCCLFLLCLRWPFLIFAIMDVAAGIRPFGCCPDATEEELDALREQMGPKG